MLTSSTYFKLSISFNIWCLCVYIAKNVLDVSGVISTAFLIASIYINFSYSSLETDASFFFFDYYSTKKNRRTWFYHMITFSPPNPLIQKSQNSRLRTFFAGQRMRLWRRKKDGSTDMTFFFLFFTIERHSLRCGETRRWTTLGI